MSGRVCPSCGTEIVYSGRGRPRVYCSDCTPAGCSGTQRHAAWYAANKDRLEAERREAHAARMAEWRESMRQNRETMARNRRRMEAKSARRHQPENESDAPLATCRTTCESKGAAFIDAPSPPGR
jgi:hypothetical protein